MSVTSQSSSQRAQSTAASISVRLTLDAELSVARFPAPLPFPELQKDHDLRRRALVACLQSSELNDLLAYVLARDAKVTEGIAAAATAPTGALVRRAAAAAGDAVLSEEIARRAGEASPRDVSDWLMEAVLSRLDVRSAVVSALTVQPDC